jgi:amino acid adenylation domain-containing protein
MSKSNNVQNIYGLSPMQKGMLFHTVLDEQSTAYVEQTVMTLRGMLDPILFETALQELVSRYDILRTVFVYKTTKRPRQVVLNGQKADFYFEDLSHKPEGAGTAYVKDFIRENREKRFDLTRDPLLRVSLFKVAAQTWWLVWTFHHILMDGWCLGILFKDFIHLYYARQSGKPMTMEPVLPYSRYIQWLEKQDRQKGLDYWKSFLEGCEAPAGLPKLRRSPDNARYQGGEYWFVVEESLTQQLRQIARNNRLTESTLFQVLWGILLQKYNDTRDVVFGVVVSGRSAEIPGIEKMVGLFINTVPARINTEDGEVFSHLLKKVQLHTLQSKPYEFLPLADIQTSSSLQKQPLDHIVVFENYPRDKSVRDAGSPGSSGFMVEYVEMHEQSNYDLNVVFSPARQMGIKFIFNRTVYDEEFIKQVAGQLKEMARQVVNNPGIKISEIDAITGEERQRLLIDLNDTQTGYPKDKTLHRLFEEQAEKVPEREAVVGNRQLAIGKKEKTHIIYRVLNEKANQVAEVLREKGVLADDIIGIMVVRSIEMIIGILGILKAGGAYLPIDPDYPQERIDYMLKDSGARILLTNLSEGHHFHHSSNRFIDHHPGGLAYVIYTSGTIGKPRGVMTTHGNAVRVVKCSNYIEITPQDRVMQISNYAFDGSIFDIFGALLNGAVLVMMEGEGISALDRLPGQIKREQITVFFVTTALFNALVDLDIGCLKDIRRVLYGGERISVPHAQRALHYMGPGRIIHVYGPTETTVYATYYPIDAIDETRVTIPIGKPLSNTTVYILNKELNVVPVGAVGELYIGGEGVARGYLNRPELTAERFFVSSYRSYRSYRTYSSKKLYKTGDLVRMFPDGNIEFIGRVDRQVKIRGFRIEPGEIESRLLMHDKIKEVVVVVKEDEKGEKYLCAYFVIKEEAAFVESPGSTELREYLSYTLPYYMLPAIFVRIEKIPLTPNGKFDIKALPGPTAVPVVQYAAPGNEVEKKLAKIWLDVLGPGREGVGIDDNFFECGGHSLKAAILTARIHQRFNMRVPLAEIFRNPTVRELARYLRGAEKEKFTTMEPVEEKEFYELSYNQKRLWILTQLSPESTFFNIVEVTQFNHEVEPAAVKEVLYRLLARHESLRTAFKETNGQVYQVIEKKVAVNFKMFDISAFAEKEKQEKRTLIIRDTAGTPFDLSTAPLFKMAFIKLAERDYVFVFNMHHIISDGWSMTILKKEFSLLYEGRRTGKEKELIPLALQYKDFAAWSNKQLNDPGIKARSHRFWKERLKQGIPALELQRDFKGNREDRRGAGYRLMVLGETKDKLKKLARDYNTSLFMVMFSIYIIFLARFSGLSNRKEIVCSIISSGREHLSLFNIIGFFINSVIFKITVDHEENFTCFLQRVHTDVMEIFQHQDYPLELVCEDLKMRHPEIPVSFNFLNLPDETEEMDLGTLEPYHLPEINDVKFDIEPYITEYKNGIDIFLSYRKNMFKPDIIEYMMREYAGLLEFFSGNPDKSFNDYKLTKKKKTIWKN